MNIFLQCIIFRENPDYCYEDSDDDSGVTISQSRFVKEGKSKTKMSVSYKSQGDRHQNPNFVRSPLQPMFQQPMFQQSMFQQPMFQQPMFQQPMFQQPMFQQLPYHQYQPAMNPLSQQPDLRYSTLPCQFPQQQQFKASKEDRWVSYLVPR